MLVYIMTLNNKMNLPFNKKREIFWASRKYSNHKESLVVASSGQTEDIKAARLFTWHLTNEGSCNTH